MKKLSQSEASNYRIRLREEEEKRRHHEQIATCGHCGAQMRRRLDGTWWHSTKGRGAQCKLT